MLSRGNTTHIIGTLFTDNEQLQSIHKPVLLSIALLYNPEMQGLTGILGLEPRTSDFVELRSFHLSYIPTSCTVTTYLRVFSCDRQSRKWLHRLSASHMPPHAESNFILYSYGLWPFASTVGFEPTSPRGQTVFKTAAFTTQPRWQNGVYRTRTYTPSLTDGLASRCDTITPILLVQFRTKIITDFQDAALSFYLRCSAYAQIARATCDLLITDISALVVHSCASVTLLFWTRYRRSTAFLFRSVGIEPTTCQFCLRLQFPEVNGIEPFSREIFAEKWDYATVSQHSQWG